MAEPLPRHAVQHRQRQVVGGVGVQGGPAPPAGLCDQAGLGALLVAGQGGAAHVAAPRAVSAASHRDQSGSRRRGPGGRVLTVGAAGVKGQNVDKLTCLHKQTELFTNKCPRLLISTIEEDKQQNPQRFGPIGL